MSHYLRPRPSDMLILFIHMVFFPLSLDLRDFFLHNYNNWFKMLMVRVFFFHLSMLSLNRDILFLWIQIWVVYLYRTLEVVQISFQQLNGFIPSLAVCAQTLVFFRTRRHSRRALLVLPQSKLLLSLLLNIIRVTQTYDVSIIAKKMGA